MMKGYKAYAFFFLVMTMVVTSSMGKSVSKTSNQFSLGDVGVLSKAIQERTGLNVRLDSRRIYHRGFPGEAQRITVTDLHGRLIASNKPGGSDACYFFPSRLNPGCYLVTIASSCFAITSIHVVLP
jgi:hypothetical protein